MADVLRRAVAGPGGADAPSGAGDEGGETVMVSGSSSDIVTIGFDVGVVSGGVHGLPKTRNVAAFSVFVGTFRNGPSSAFSFLSSFITFNAFLTTKTCLNLSKST